MRPAGSSVFVRSADRRALLLGTALVSTFLMGALASPSTGLAQATCFPGDPGVTGTTGPIGIGPGAGAIDCVNTFNRNNGAANEVIRLQTNNVNEFISLDNSGRLTANNPGGNAFGILAETNANNGDIDIMNSGDIRASSDVSGAYGINADAGGFGTPNSTVSVVNEGRIEALADTRAISISAASGADNGAVEIINTGDMTVAGQTSSVGIFGYMDGDGPVTIHNSGDLNLTSAVRGDAIHAQSVGSDSSVAVYNSGDIDITSGGSARGVRTYTDGPDSRTLVHNTGDIDIEGQLGVYGIFAGAVRQNSPITVYNSGNIETTSPRFSYGQFAFTPSVLVAGRFSPIARSASAITAPPTRVPVMLTTAGPTAFSPGPRA